MPASLRGQAFAVKPGPSILELLWRELDDQMGKLIALMDQGWGESDPVRRGQSGHCLGLAKAIAILTNPYDPDVNAIRAEAVRRHNAKANHAGTSEAG